MRLSTERTFDYVPRLDERNRSFRVGAADPSLLQKSRFWVPSNVVTDQKSEGACVGFGVTNEWLASPVRGRLGRNLHPLAQFESANRTSRAVYARAKEIDEWEGVDYDGTSVRAGMLVGRELGWWDGFRWALNMAELRAALEDGPVVVGVEWRSDMDEAPNGVLTPGGISVGGHCLLVTGSTPRSYRTGKPSKRVRNSWGEDWGINGSAEIADDHLDRILFKAGGEAAVAIGRKV